MPKSPPRPEKIMEEVENKSAFQSIGMKLPMVEPAKRPIQINVFVIYSF